MTRATSLTIPRRRSLWQRMVERQTLARRPVSVRRQRLGAGTLVVLTTAAAWYGVTTRDEAIRRRAVDFLAKATGGEIAVERAEFGMFEGIILHGVRVSVPYSEQLDPSAVDTESREIFSAATLRLVHNPWRLLLGGLRVEEVVATRPRIVLAHNIDTGMRNWQLLAAREGPAQTRGALYRPRITLRSAVAEVVSISSSGPHQARTEELDADVRPHAQGQTAFGIEVRRYSDPPERTMVVFDPGARLVTNTPFVDARTIRLQVPRLVQQFFDRINLQGEAKLSRFIYDSTQPRDRDTEVELRNVQCFVPLSMLKSGLSAGITEPAEPASQPTGDWALQMTNVRGRFELAGDQLEVDVTGLVNGAACAVSGSLQNVEAPFDQMGIDLTIHGSEVPAPEGALREHLLTGTNVPRELRAFLADYDPHGVFDLDFHFVRAAGTGEPVRLVGTMRPRGVRAACAWFTYPVEDVSGLIRFEREGVYLEGVHGRQGSAEIRASGKIDRARDCAAAEVDITGTGVLLDDKLFAPLPDHYKSIWRQFEPQGAANVVVSVRREGADGDEPRPAWHTAVKAEMVDAQMCFQAYPYPLRGVHGVVEIDRDQMRFVGLTGHRGGATVRIDGAAAHGPSQRPQIDLRIQADSLPLDETLANVLPLEARTVLSEFQPSGLVDLVGTVIRQDPRAGFAYDMRVDLRQATLCYKRFPYRVNNVSALVDIRPEGVSVLQASGRAGAGSFTASGTVQRLEACPANPVGDGHLGDADTGEALVPQSLGQARGSGVVADLAFTCEDLVLDEQLYEALPEAIRRVWRMLRPSGVVRARTTFHDVVQNGRHRQRYRTEVEITNGELCFQGLPLPISAVAARCLVTDDRLEICSLRGRIGDGTVELNGQIDLVGPGMRGTLQVRATDVMLDEPFIAAMPGRLRQWLVSAKATGGFDLRLEHLQFETDVDGGTDWDFAGSLRLHDARGRFGFELRDATGLMTGGGHMTPDGTLAGAAELNLERIVLAGWHLNDATAKIVVDPQARLVSVQNASAGVYDGQATGYAEVELGAKRTHYQVSAAATGIQLDKYVSVHRRPSGAGAPPGGPARGTIDLNVALRGQTGKGGYLEGLGELFIHEAQIWKLPVGLAVFQVLNLSPDENVFHDGWAQYSLMKDRLTFERIDLRGSAVSFIGRGQMDLGTRQLNVTLLAGSPVRLQVPLLTEIVEEASRELMEVQVTGTLDRPHIRPQPLRSLTEALETLFPESSGRSD